MFSVVFLRTVLIICPSPIKVWVLISVTQKVLKAAAFYGIGQATQKLTLVLCSLSLFRTKLRAVKNVGKNFRKLLENSKVTALQLLKYSKRNANILTPGTYCIKIQPE